MSKDGRTFWDFIAEHDACDLLLLFLLFGSVTISFLAAIAGLFSGQTK